MTYIYIYMLPIVWDIKHKQPQDLLVEGVPYLGYDWASVIGKETLSCSNHGPACSVPNISSVLSFHVPYIHTKINLICQHPNPKAYV